MIFDKFNALFKKEAKEKIVYDELEAAIFIYKRTGIDKDTILEVLESDFWYQVAKGIIKYNGNTIPEDVTAEDYVRNH